MYSGDSGGSTHYRGQPNHDHNIGASSHVSGQETSSALSYSAQYGSSSSSSAIPDHHSQPATSHVLLENYHEIDPHLQQLRELEHYQQRRLSARYSHPQAEQWPAHEFISHSISAAAPSYFSGNLNIGTAPPSLTTQQEQEQLLMQNASPQSLHLQGLSPMEQILYNEQLMLRIQACGVEHRSASYESLSNQATGHTISSSSSEYGTAAAGRYEETCTPRPRWSPTQEQIQILESLFNSGTTTPSRDMIVEIAAQLRKYGPIAEANVFYWFQNRKARAKRKQQAQPRVRPSS
ncbi:hypothetical protein GOP47_0004468 [Adiantum capillus-veneris]|uniref:Homeobox domain-containing protein n=1 Tax=Adiantum capillus-veneris TaxID=13818 RepID=A0A9D4V7I7_ADICA|nr:hypothetical protein GOP47_0004468 [Adiantum capillus-veneris]